MVVYLQFFFLVAIFPLFKYKSRGEDTEVSLLTGAVVRYNFLMKIYASLQELSTHWIFISQAHKNLNESCAWVPPQAHPASRRRAPARTKIKTPTRVFLFWCAH